MRLTIVSFFRAKQVNSHAPRAEQLSRQFDFSSMLKVIFRKAKAQTSSTAVLFRCDFPPTFRSRGKRSAAAAGSGCVGVGEFKAAAVEARDEIYNGALEEGNTFGIHVNREVLEF